jgi:N-acetylglutamate synthase-like GNAT family acetyltransferase
MPELPAITRPFRLDLPALQRLLSSADPADTGLPAALDDYLVARDGERLVGAIGADYRGAVAVVRALVVAPAAPAPDLERALVAALLADAHRMGARYLLAAAPAGGEPYHHLGFAALDAESRAAALAAGIAVDDGAHLARAVD